MSHSTKHRADCRRVFNRYDMDCQHSRRYWAKTGQIRHMGDAIMTRQTYIEMAQELAAWANQDWNAFHTVSPFVAFQQMGYSSAEAGLWMRANSEEEW